MPTHTLSPHRTLTFTPLLVPGDNGPNQICRLQIADLPHPSTGTLTIRRDGADWSFPLNLPAGDSTHEAHLPEATSDTTALVELVIGGETVTQEVPCTPVRRWQVFLVNHSHTDIGFTHTAADVVRVHDKNLERALELTDATADWPWESRYRWTIESAWQVQNYLTYRPEDRDRLVRAVREGVVEVEALYIHSYFDLLGREQLVRSLYLAQELRETLGIPITSAMICDVPGCAWSLVDPMAAAGVRYLGIAPNNYLAPFHAITNLKRPFVWEGPAGRRVLVWYTDDPYWAYIEGARHGFWSGYAEVEAKLPAKLDQLQADGYALDILQIQTGSDNRPLRLLPATIARDWNRTYVSPRLRLATPSEFFREVEAGWMDRVETVRGEWQSSWSQTTMHYPKEAAESRRNHGTLDAWERLAVAADLLDEAFIYPTEEIAKTYDASLLFDEHSGPKGIWRPRSEAEALAAIEQGYEIFRRATAPAQAGLARALSAATGVLASGETNEIAVWNPLGRPQSGPAESHIPADWVSAGTSLIDAATDSPVPFETAGAHGDTVTVRFAAENVPAVGYRRYRLTPGAAGGHVRASRREAGPEARLERGPLSVVLNENGEITSLADSRTGTDLAAAGLNALVRYLPEPHGPEPGGDFNAATNLYEGIPVKGEEIASTPVESSAITVEEAGAEIRATAHAVYADIYERTVDVRLREDWLEVRNRVTWLQRPPENEMVYLLYPFALPMPRVRHAAQYAIVDPQTETLSGSSLDAFAVQDWIDLSADGRGVTVSSSDLPLVEYGGVRLQHFLRRLEVAEGTLAFKLAAGRVLPPNPGDPFGQGATVEARFAIRPYTGAFDPIASTRFGEEQVLPLQAHPMAARQPGHWNDATLGLVDLQGPTAVLTGLKRAERADGLVLRLWESAGRHTPVTLTFPHHDLLTAWSLSPVEGTIGRMDVRDGRVEFELGPHELRTVRVVLGR